MKNSRFSWYRVKTVTKRELLQIWRDKISFTAMLIVPILQVILYGFVLNSNPKHMPMVVVDQNRTAFSRAIIKGFENTQYFDVVGELSDINKADRLLNTGKTQFVLFIPSTFSHDLVRGLQPAILLNADATNNMASSGGMNAAIALESRVLDDLLKGVIDTKQTPPPFEITVQQKFNPTGRPQYFSVPGVMCISLSLIMLTMTLMSVVREKEGSTMESLLITPAKPLEIMAGKVVPFMLVVYTQIMINLILARIVFDVPFAGSYLLFFVAALPFVVSSLFVGLFFSTITTNQYQASQLASLYALPNFIFSGFIFPYKGMPLWAQWFGEIFPLTHFLRIALGIMIKGNGFYAILPSLLPLTLIMVVLITITTLSYKQTLD